MILLKIQNYKDIWPILKGSGKKPEWWQGWLNEKKIALILTHDVENKVGYEKVLKLMEIEKELGFVSSFNFVPEREYTVEVSLLNTLKENGFEYGVHGLYHDGKLFSSEEEFLERAKKINNYLREWGAVGFRAPSMHHDLDLIGTLNIKYDLSTFDTDPFEPQPDGMGTIFPFKVINKKTKREYWEFPYTLAQDFTLLVLMKENSIDIWKRKLDWIVENGGMALINVHPDYINFENKKTLEEFQVSYYEDFLRYVLETYKDQFWNPLPKELADYLDSTTHAIINIDNKTVRFAE
jgi:hypothetical protein